ncbi:hypothetical protein TruAng_004394 [Truncatella angustata]|nr:hypothetical protein TruAng_004394 [Truncatella angustata]
MQSVLATSLRIPIIAFELGLLLSLSSLVLVAASVTKDRNALNSIIRDRSLVSCLRISGMIILIGQSLGALCIPRRPDVFCDGRLVDRRYTESFLSRITWSWCAETFQNRSEKDHLNIRDLPGPNCVIRAKDTTSEWQGSESGRSLSKSIIFSHRFKFAQQWALTIIGSLLDFAPQWCVLKFLRIIEQRDIRGTPEDDAWPWVIGIALTMMAQSWTESYSSWISSAELCIPVRTQLSSLIFEKATRQQKPKAGGASSETQAAQSKSTKEKEFSADGDNFSTTNLFSADVRRVSDFCSFNRYLPGSLCKLALSWIFLFHLLGWQPLLSGLCAMLAITPINALYSRKYAEVQGRLMTARDEKMRFVSEALSGLRFIKFSALEHEWEERINRLRDMEVSRISEAFWYDTVLSGCWIASPIMLATVCLGVYASIHGTLSPSVAFVSLGVFDSLQVALSFVPELMAMFYDARISSRRIDAYLQCPGIEKSTQAAEEIAFNNATIAWPVDSGDRLSDVFMLRNVTVRFPQGELSIISGQTGAGKSLMLAAILGDVEVLAGSVRVPKQPDLNRPQLQHAMTRRWIIPNSIAFVAQTAWLENKTIKENIQFGLPYHEERYRKTISVCALEADLAMMEDGDNTEIGPNGTNLSGGQKCRIAIARAIYSRAGILVLDDIFSAVDVHVGRQILVDCLNGELGVGRTRIIATHHVELCRPYARYICHLSDGTVNIIPTNPSDQLTQAGFTSSNTGFQRWVPNYETVAQRPCTGPHPKAFVQEETQSHGATKRHVYLAFLEASGGRLIWCCMLSLYVLVQALIIGKSWWLRTWTGSYKRSAHELDDLVRTSTIPAAMQHNLFAENVQITSLSGYSLNLYLGVYILLSLVSAFLGTVKLYYMFFSSVKASKELFRKLNFAVLRAPLRWLDTVPRGRVLNRYTADFHSIDTHLARYLEFGLSSFFNIIGIILTGLFVSPAILALATILILASVSYARYYLQCARPIKRLESVMRSPVFEHFDSTLCGVATIRAFAKVNDYIRQMDKKLDDWAVTTWHLEVFKEWMAWRITALGSVFASCVALVIWLNPDVDAALAGFALAFSLEISKAILLIVDCYTNVELEMNAVERIVEFSEIPTENLGGSDVPAAWPSEGRIEVQDLVISYATDTQPVLKGISFSINSNERIGVVGRTGAGKSTLALALFRFLEAESGSIKLDGIDIAKIRLSDLRSRLAIIPQDPKLFSGTLRSNLDPLGQYTDAELFECLRRAQINPEHPLDATSSPTPVNGNLHENSSVFGSLYTCVSESGLNLSQGQRQLVCLARAIVGRPKVMVLDEATSAVDMTTDTLIQASIRKEFQDCTLIVIAHRLSTVADFDRILVLSDGNMAEYGTPKELWELGKGVGVFRDMCENSGDKDKLRDICLNKTYAADAA